MIAIVGALVVGFILPKNWKAIIWLFAFGAIFLGVCLYLVSFDGERTFNLILLRGDDANRPDLGRFIVVAHMAILGAIIASLRLLIAPRASSN